jgi:hypothetical protein
LLQLPVTVWAQVQERIDALLREFALITTGGQVQSHHVPQRLLALIKSLDVQFSGVSASQELLLRDAHEAGQRVIDLQYQVPGAVVEASIALGEMLDEADAYCADGQHLLTLEPTVEELRFRRWFLGQFIEQVGGQPPVAWPDWP